MRPPSWFDPIRAFIQGRAYVPKSDAEIVRDMLLEGRDDEAMALLDLARGFRFYFDRELWAALRYSRNRDHAVARSLRYFVDGSEVAEEAADFATAVGMAVTSHLADLHGGPAVVRTSLDYALPVTAFSTKYDNAIVFVIAGTESEIKALVPNARAIR